MTKTRPKLRGFFALALLCAALPAPVYAQPKPAPPDLNALGPENSQLLQQVGVWDVEETVWATPGAAPVVIKGVAERVMVGAFLQETLRPALGSPTVWRMDYLNFQRVEGRWKYVSMEMRAPVGIMFAQSFGRGQNGQIDVTFDAFAAPDSGQLLQMNQVIAQPDADHVVKDQRFSVADSQGKAQVWLAHRYSYTRRAAPTKQP